MVRGDATSLIKSMTEKSRFSEKRESFPVEFMSFTIKVTAAEEKKPSNSLYFNALYRKTGRPMERDFEAESKIDPTGILDHDTKISIHSVEQKVNPVMYDADHKRIVVVRSAEKV